jgi:RHS repeat-associated protein
MNNTLTLELDHSPGAGHYDPWGRLTGATVASQTLTYTYDALDRPQSRTVQNGTTTTYTYTGTANTLSSSQIGTAAPTYYATDPTGTPLAQQQGTATRFLLQDPHGNIAAFLDPTTGNATGTISYDPWGNPTTVGTDAQTSLIAYQSQLQDPTTGLVQMGARNYDPTQGRFTTQDTVFGTPSDPISLNQYIYGTDSPLLNTDPTGNMPSCNCDNSATQRRLNNEYEHSGAPQAIATALYEAAPAPIIAPLPPTIRTLHGFLVNPGGSHGGNNSFLVRAVDATLVGPFQSVWGEFTSFLRTPCAFGDEPREVGSGDGGGLGCSGGGAPFTVDQTQVEKKFDDHAPDFGVTLPKGAAGYRALAEALRKFQADPANPTITGTYQSQPAIFTYDPETRLVVIQRASGAYWTGFEFTPTQFARLLQTGEAGRW